MTVSLKHINYTYIGLPVKRFSPKKTHLTERIVKRI